jgi:hypothetical protein
VRRRADDDLEVAGMRPYGLRGRPPAQRAFARIAASGIDALLGGERLGARGSDSGRDAVVAKCDPDPGYAVSAWGVPAAPSESTISGARRGPQQEPHQPHEHREGQRDHDDLRRRVKAEASWRRIASSWW